MASSEDVVNYLAASSAIIADLTEQEAIRKRLRESISETEAEQQSLLKEVADLRVESDYLDRELGTLNAHYESTSLQIKMMDQTVLPQLRKELKERQDLVKAKKAHLTKIIEQYQSRWQTYEAIYNTFPRVAERNALEKELKLMRIELLKKKQEMAEKEKQSKQMQQIKAHRLQILKKEYLLLRKENEDLTNKYEVLLKETDEMEARVAKKEAEKLSHVPVTSPIKEAAPSPASVFINIPTLKLPCFADFQISSTRISSSQPLPQTGNQTDCQIPISWISSSQGALPAFHSVAQRELSQAALPAIPHKVQVEGAQQPTNSSAILDSAPSMPSPSVLESSSKRHSTSPLNVSGSKQLQTSVPIDGFEENRNVDNAGSLTESQSVFSASKRNHAGQLLQVDGQVMSVEVSDSTGLECRTPNAGNNKKQFILSTDTIAAKLKETIRPSPKATSSTNTNSVETSKMVMTGQDAAVISQDSITNQDSNIGHSKAGKNYFESDESEQIGESSNVTPPETELKKNKQQENQFDDTNEVEDIFMEDIESSGNDAPFGFNDEYEDDMYTDLRSPPAFDAVMSPVHAGIDSLSPAHSLDDESPKDPQDDANQAPAFSKFSFFSSTARNIFGSQSDDAKKQDDNPTSHPSFSFMF